MSEFRIFCISAFSGTGILSAFLNHVVHAPGTGDEASKLLLMLALFGCGGVTLFGRRKSS